MNRLLAACFILASYAAISQVGTVTIDGFRELKIGQPISVVKKYLTPTEQVPQYAWFATPEFAYFQQLMGFEDGAKLTEDDSLQIEITMEMAYRFCDGQSFVPIHKDYQTIHGFRIEAYRICLDEENRISAVYIVLDKKDLDAESKEMIKTLFSSDLGIEYCEQSIVGDAPPFPFACFQWADESGREAVISDMYAEGGGFGESVNIVFR